MKRKWSITSIVIFGLMVIGLLYSFVQNIQTMIIPILVFGVVLYFYKFPPKRFGSGSPYNARGYAPKRNAKPAKKRPFRVIEGRKSDSDETPKYH